MDTVFSQLLLGKGSRRAYGVDKVIQSVGDQQSFDALFALLFHHERRLVMRAAAAVEKITVRQNDYLTPHKSQILALIRSADHKDLKGHLASWVARLSFSQEELECVWHTLTYWLRNSYEGKNTRLHALQGLFDLAQRHPQQRDDLRESASAVSHEPIASLQARLRKLKLI